MWPIPVSRPGSPSPPTQHCATSSSPTTSASPLDQLKDPKREYVLPSGLKIDVLFRERRTDAYVVVELKLAGGGYGLGSQLVTYMQELRNAVGPEPIIRGLLITGTTNTLLEDDVVELARTFGFQVDWLCYAASLELQPVLSSHPELNAVPAS